jgi:hypothetical protein
VSLLFVNKGKLWKEYRTKKKLCEQYPSNLIWSVLSLGGTEAWEKWGHPILCWSDISLYYLYRAGNSHFFFFPFSLFHSSYVRFSKLHPFHFCLLCTRMQAQAHLLAYRKEPGIGMSWKETRETYWLTWAIICLNRFTPIMKSYENLYALLVDASYLFIYICQIHPVVSWLCASIQETSPALLAECLSLDSSKVQLSFRLVCKWLNIVIFSLILFFFSIQIVPIKSIWSIKWRPFQCVIIDNRMKRKG